VGEGGPRPGEGSTPTPAEILDLKICDPAMGSGAFLVEACRQLAEALVKAWHAHDCVPKDIPPDEDEILHARRIVAQRCLYGVDKNPMAVDLAKLSLWLATLAKDHPFTFLDHALKCGDSLVGLSKKQILGFRWKPEHQRDFARGAIEGQLNAALEQRRQIREAPDGTAEALL
jgi:type II restriction/modification system DNA methylase subunit YeeA